MSDRWGERVRRGLGVALLVAGSASSLVARLEAQDAAPYRARVDSLAHLWVETREAAARADSLRRSGVRIDTVAAGPVLLLAPPEERGAVEAAARVVGERLPAALQADTALLRARAFFVFSDEWREPVPRFDRRRVNTVVFHHESDAADIARRIIEKLEATAALEADEDTREWLGNRVPLRPSRPQELTRVYVELATGASLAVRECYLGDLEGCADALVLTAPEDPVGEWYAPQGRRELVLRLWQRFRRTDPRRVQCVDAGVDGACAELLRSVQPEYLPPPLSREARRALTALALETGADGAYQRFLHAPTPDVDARLTNAAGVPRDSLLAGWRAAVLAARPEPTTITRSVGWTAFLWIVVFAVAAARSSRWRRA
jgi:hypothetical protein